MKVMKFGGTSVGSLERILEVARIIKQSSREDKIIVVVSAMCGVTDQLISVFKLYKEKKIAEALETLNQIFQRHFKAEKELKLTNGHGKRSEISLKELLGQLITSLTFAKSFDLTDYDYVVSYGERLSSYLLSLALKKIGVKAISIDSADILVTDNKFGNAKVLLTETEERVEKILWPLLLNGIVPVITGFFGATRDGKITTLGRGGSDYSATILAYALDAQEVVLWKEVDGIYSSDPKKDGYAKFYPAISYIQAIKLAKNGAKILHPEAIEPVMRKKIIVWVKNTFKPELKGSKIWKGVS